MGEANRTGKTRTPRQAIDPATLHGDARAVKRAISGGADPNATYQRRPLLAIALWTKNKSLIAALIRAGANPIPLDRAAAAVRIGRGMITPDGRRRARLARRGVPLPRQCRRRSGRLPGSAPPSLNCSQPLGLRLPSSEGYKADGGVGNGIGWSGHAGGPS